MDGRCFCQFILRCGVNFPGYGFFKFTKWFFFVWKQWENEIFKINLKIVVKSKKLSWVTALWVTITAKHYIGGRSSAFKTSLIDVLVLVLVPHPLLTLPHKNKQTNKLHTHENETEQTNKNKTKSNKKGIKHKKITVKYFYINIKFSKSTKNSIFLTIVIIFTFVEVLPSIFL